MTGNCIVQLNTFIENIQLSWKQLQADKEFSDITLACNDKELQAHKAIICDYSPIFKSILKQTESQAPFIYISDVSYAELENLLCFMYQGEVNIDSSELKRFLDLAEYLQIKGLTGISQSNESLVFASIRKRNKSELKTSETEFTMKNEESVSHAQYLENLFNKGVIGDKNQSKNNVEHNITDGRNNIEQGLNFDISIGMLMKTEKSENEVTVSESAQKQMTCSKCLKCFSNKGNLKSHIKFMHKNITNREVSKGTKEDFLCEKCLKSFSNKSHLKRHIQSIHEGIQYPCHLCSFVATQKSNLQIHIKKYHSSTFLTEFSENIESPNKDNVLTKEQKIENDEERESGPDQYEMEFLQKEEANVNLSVYIENISEKENIDDKHISHYIKAYNTTNDTNGIEEDCSFNESIGISTKSKHRKCKNEIKETFFCKRVKKDFICDKCLKNFSNKSHLKRHIQSIHEGIQYACHQCNFSATQKGHLHIHTKKHHAEVSL